MNVYANSGDWDTITTTQYALSPKEIERNEKETCQTNNKIAFVYDVFPKVTGTDFWTFILHFTEPAAPILFSTYPCYAFPKVTIPCKKTSEDR